MSEQTFRIRLLKGWAFDGKWRPPGTLCRASAREAYELLIEGRAVLLNEANLPALAAAVKAEAGAAAPRG